MNEQTEHDTCEAKQVSPLEQATNQVFELLIEHQDLLLTLERRLAPVCRPEIDEAACAEKECDVTRMSPAVTQLLDMASMVQGISESVVRLTGRLDVS